MRTTNIVESLCSFFGITDNGNFSADRFCKSMNNIFKAFCGIIVKTYFAALITDLRRHVFYNNNAFTQIGGKIRNSILHGTFTHKTNHFILLCLKSSVHSSLLGKYAVINHNSIPFEPQTTCNVRPVIVFPNTRQLGKG